MGPRLLGVIDRADRMRLSLWAGTFDFIERQFRTCGDHEVIVLEPAAVLQFQRITRCVDARDALGNELDALLLQIWADRQGNGVPLTPAHGQPGIGGYELKVVHRIGHSDAVRAICYFVDDPLTPILKYTMLLLVQTKRAYLDSLWRSTTMSDSLVLRPMSETVRG